MKQSLLLRSRVVALYLTLGLIALPSHNGLAADKPSADKAQRTDCQDLLPGDSRVVAETDFTSPRHTARRYRVTRDRGNSQQYNIDLNYVFEPRERNQEFY